MRNKNFFIPRTGDWDTRYDSAIERLLNEITEDAQATAKWTGYQNFQKEVLQALKGIPRHRFVATNNQAEAYANRPLPIGFGQTISQPYIVALMTAALELNSCDRVLEVGTGCGYQTAILAELVNNVFTIEVIPELAAIARKNLNQLGYNEINFRIGNGREGWPIHAPFPAILVTAASENLPLNLVDQLDAGGRMVVPIGPQGGDQTLLLLKKHETGNVTEKSLLPVSFVPLIK